MARDKKGNDKAYSRENETIKYYRDFVQQPGLTKMDYVAAMDEMCSHYDQLLTDTKLLTSVGDRLQRKLKGANQMLQQQSDEIQQKNEQLKDKNIQLKLTIDELTRARASRKARAYTLLAAIVLFVATELLEEIFEANMPAWGAWGMKGLLVLLIKPIESFIENYFVKQSMNKEQRQQMEGAMSDDDDEEEAKQDAATKDAHATA